MRVFIQAKNGTPTDQDHFNAYIGFREMGFETVFLKPLRNWQKAKWTMWWWDTSIPLLLV